MNKFNIIVILIGLNISISCNNIIQKSTTKDNNLKINYSQIAIDTAISSNSNALLFRDLNGDRMSDVILISQNGELSWYMYPGWEKYTITNTKNRLSSDAEIIDIDQDGDNDIVIAEKDPISNIVWFENSGTQDNHWTKHFIAQVGAVDIEAVDLDNDNDFDIISRADGKDSEIIHIWLQNSPSDFSHKTIKCHPGAGLKCCDINGDEKPDIITGNIWFEAPHDLNSLNWIQHAFVENWPYNSNIIEIGNLDNDEFPEIVFYPMSEPGDELPLVFLSMHNQNGKIDWNEHVISTKLTGQVQSIRICDFNFDGNNDFVVSCLNSTNEYLKLILFSKSSNGWSYEMVKEFNARFIEIFDFNNDGDFDIFGINVSHRNSLELFENISNPYSKIPTKFDLKHWTSYTIDFLKNDNFCCLVSKDLTGDKRADIAFGDYFYVNLSESSNSEWSRIEFPVQAHPIIALDVDGDNHGDIISINSSGQLFWLEAENSLASTWTYNEIGSLGNLSKSGLRMGYSYGVLNQGDDPVIIINNGTLYCFKIPDYPGEHQWERYVISGNAIPGAIGVGDIDCDGDNDITGVFGNSKIAWWENPGNGAFNWKPHDISTFPYTYVDNIFVSDINGDHLSDVIISARRMDKHGLYLWKQSRVPSQNRWINDIIVEGNFPLTLDVADMDNDGDFDLISGEFGGNKHHNIWENSGNGVFTKQTINEQNESYLLSKIVDIDNDNDLDIIAIAKKDKKYLIVFENEANTIKNKYKQFVLIDTLMIYTNLNSTNSESFLTTNPNVPSNWKFPIDFSDGILQFRLEIIEMNETQTPIEFVFGWNNLNKILDPGLQFRKCQPVKFNKPGVYESTVNMKKMWHGPHFGNKTLSWDWERAIYDKQVFVSFNSFGQDPFPIKFRIVTTIKENRIL